MPSRAEPRPHSSDHGVYGVPGDVSPWDIRFEPNDRAFLNRQFDGRYSVRLAAEPALVDAAVVVGAAGAAARIHSMDRTAESRRFNLWEAEIDVSPGTEYTLAFRTPAGQGAYRVPSGMSSAVERLDRWRFPNIDPLTVPEWVQGAVIYQIFPDRFANADPATDPPGVAPWGSDPHPLEFQGGDLLGIAENLDYLASIGIDVLYLNPIFTSPSTHRFDTIDYYQVDPVLGGNAALEQLVKVAHSMSMRVILDASFNHVHPRFFAFADLVANGEDSPYRDWFIVADPPARVLHRPRSTERPDWTDHWATAWNGEMGLPVEEVSGDGPAIEATYETWYGIPTMPRIDLSHPEAGSYFTGVASHWLRRFDIDGWRMDVVRYVDPDFWDHLRTAVKAAKPDAYLLAEIMGDARPWLQGNRFDATMNYTFRSIAVSFFATDETDGETFLDHASRLVSQYAWPITLANHNLLSSHDTPRFLTLSAGELWRLELATVFQLTFPGAPGIFYGDEIGLDGSDDPSCRKAFPTNVDATRHPIYRTIAGLVALRRCEPTLVKGAWRPVSASRNLVAYERSLGERRLLIIFNRDDAEATLEYASAGSELLWGPGHVSANRVTLPAHSSVILALA